MFHIIIKFYCPIFRSVVNKWNLYFGILIIFMRGESRSRSKSPTRNQDFRGGDKGDRPPPEPPSNKVYVTFLPENVHLAIFRFNKDNLKKSLKNVAQ